MFLQLYKAFTDAITDGSKDESTNIMVITGNGDYFCAGADLKEGTLGGPNSQFK